MAMDPITVWMIHARTGRSGTKGQLALEPGSLVFRPSSRTSVETVIEVRDIKRVRRVKGSPVLELHLHTPNRLAVEVMGFYFTRPPSLEDPEDVRIFKRRVAKRRALVDLRRANLAKKEQIAGWVDAIDRARES